MMSSKVTRDWVANKGAEVMKVVGHQTVRTSVLGRGICLLFFR